MERRAALERDEALRNCLSGFEDERLRLSQDLHDHAGQHIAGLLLGLRLLSKHIHSEEGAQQLGRLCGQVDEIASEFHGVMASLRPVSIDPTGLAPAVCQRLADWTEASGIETALRVEGDVTLPDPIGTVLYRLVQEALTNVVKHAETATLVEVRIVATPRRVSLCIEDDGRGFVRNGKETMKTFVARHKFGIAGIHERVARLGGTLNLSTAAGRGLSVTASIPFPERRR